MMHSVQVLEAFMGTFSDTKTYTGTILEMTQEVGLKKIVGCYLHTLCHYSTAVGSSSCWLSLQIWCWWGVFILAPKLVVHAQNQVFFNLVVMLV